MIRRSAIRLCEKIMLKPLIWRMFVPIR